MNAGEVISRMIHNCALRRQNGLVERDEDIWGKEDLVYRGKLGRRGRYKGMKSRGERKKTQALRTGSMKMRTMEVSGNSIYYYGNESCLDQ